MMRTSFARFPRLPWQERLRTIEAVIVLTTIMALLKAAGYRRTRTMLARLPRRVSRPLPDELRDDEVASLAWSVAAVASNFPVANTCLQRTLALWWMLQRRSIDSDIRIGAVRTEEGILAHAWLERNGVVINDDAGITGRYIPFQRMN